jgi:cytochrome c553
MNYKQFTSLLLFFTFSSNLWADEAMVGNSKTGEKLYGICAGCHGANGEGNQAMKAPRLAGQHDWYLRTQLSNFRSGARGATEGDEAGPMMRSMALSLEDDQAVFDVVAYISSLK